MWKQTIGQVKGMDTLWCDTWSIFSQPNTGSLNCNNNIWLQAYPHHYDHIIKVIKDMSKQYNWQLIAWTLRPASTSGILLLPYLYSSIIYLVVWGWWSNTPDTWLLEFLCQQYVHLHIHCISAIYCAFALWSSIIRQWLGLLQYNPCPFTSWIADHCLKYAR